MTTGFECYLDPEGNLSVADGVVFQPSTGTLKLVGSGLGGSGRAADRSISEQKRVSGAVGTTFVGGSGRNVILSGMPPILSGPPSPNGYYRPQEPGAYRMGIFTLTVTGASAASISDGTGVIANLTTGGTAPVGSYASTTYGATTYGASFTLTAAAEGDSVGIPGAVISVSAGTAPAGAMSAVDTATWQLVADTDWKIIVAADGSAELRDGATVIAERADGSPGRPEGTYVATAAGKTAHHGGAEWTAHVALVGKSSRAGFVYLKITETSGTLSAVEGPYFGALPSNSAGVYHVPIAQSDGFGTIEQFHTGMLVWPGGGGGGTSSGLEWVSLTEAEFDAITTPDPDTIYDLTDVMP